MRKGWKAVMLLAAGMVLMVLLTGCGANNEYTIDKVDVMAKVLPDGDLYVEELYTYTVRGQYDKIGRYMDDFGESNIEFFEAFVPPNDRELGNFGFENLKSYPVSLSVNNGSYDVFLQAQDETKQVYYRYRLDREALKYSDGGELDWIVFQSNDADHHNVTVTVRMEQHPKKSLIGFAYDRSGGSLVEVTDRQIRYENKQLPEQDQVRLKVFFSAEAVPELEATAAATQAERLQEETALQHKFAERERLLDVGRQTASLFTYLAAAGVVFYALSLRRVLAWWHGRHISREELESMNPVKLVSLYRKGALQSADVLAGVFALRRRGLIEISMIPSGPRFQEDRRAPKQLPLFAFGGNRSNLKGADRHLLGWLFRGTGVLDLEKISGPTEIERRQKAARSKYVQRQRRFQRAFSRWQELLKGEEGWTVTYRDYPSRRMIVPAIAFTHLLMLIYMYIADVKAWGSVAILAVILGGGAVWLSIRSRSKGYLIAYLVACFFAAAQVVHDPVVGEYFITVLISIILVVFLPGRVTDPESEAYRSAIKRYRRWLTKGGGDEGSDPDRLERMLQAALLLGVGRRFLTRARKQHADSFYATSPGLHAEGLDAIDYAFNRSWKGVASKSSAGSSGNGYGDGGSSSDGGTGDGGSDSGGDGGGGGD
ncbi:DUF2207 domain-containing protein [Paenibacillus turpanensis]|uniref:DUF2207 domain-containing protein n=1 Tax=Paenibacillus turpanensis TaxID=2689078 RepID=UPI00140B9C01|nr:DUF2207 domain-containing protein [Paenibacillus turpanensis]